MDLHRCRFVPYPASGINALAFSHDTDSDFPNPKARDDSLRLAVGRENGDIEIWNPVGWVQETIFKGGKDRSVQGLAWTQEPYEIDEGGKIVAGALRLFSIGYSNTVTEWNLATGLPQRYWSGTHSEIWCIAAQPRWKGDRNVNTGDTRRMDLVVGYADGSLDILSTAENDLQFLRSLARPTTKKARVLSLAFQDRKIVVAGYADSTIRIYHFFKSHLIRNITLGSGPKGGPKNVLVWSVKCLFNGNIVSGDSTGEVRIFDGKNWGQLQRIANHDADILDIAVSKNRGLFFTGGMDRRTAQFVPSEYRSANWVKVNHKSHHEHEVKAMASYEGNNLTALVSGGIDTKLVVADMHQYNEKYQQSVSGLPNRPPMVGTSGNRLVACWWEREVNIWEFNQTKEEQKSHCLVAKIAIRGDENITNVSITSNGSHLAVATSAEVKIFRLCRRGKGKSIEYAPKKIYTFAAQGARLVKFSKNRRWLAMISQTNSISVVWLPPKLNDPLSTPPTRFELQRLNREEDDKTKPLGTYTRSITQLEFAVDSKMLVVADLAGYIDSWTLQSKGQFNGDAKIKLEEPEQSAPENSEDEDEDEEPASDFATSKWMLNSNGQLVPRLESSPLVLRFRKQKRHILIIFTARNKLYDIDMDVGRYTPWLMSNRHKIFPKGFEKNSDRAMGSVWGADGWLWLYGGTWIFGFDSHADHTQTKRKPVEQTPSSALTPQFKKRKRNEEDTSKNVRVEEIGGLIYLDGPSGPLGSAPVQPDTMDVDTDMSASDSEVDETKQKLLEDKTKGDDGVHQDAEGNDDRKTVLLHKYRPILGMVQILKPQKGSMPQVILVERPTFDLDLPARYEGGYE